MRTVLFDTVARGCPANRQTGAIKASSARRDRNPLRLTMKEHTGMLDDLLSMVGEGRRTLPPTTSIPLERFQEAIAMADGGSSEGKKVLLRLSNIVR